MYLIYIILLVTLKMLMSLFDLQKSKVTQYLYLLTSLLLLV